MLLLIDSTFNTGISRLSGPIVLYRKKKCYARMEWYGLVTVHSRKTKYFTFVQAP